MEKEKLSRRRFLENLAGLTAVCSSGGSIRNYKIREKGENLTENNRRDYEIIYDESGFSSGAGFEISEEYPR
jgi:hypothetical protein